MAGHNEIRNDLSGRVHGHNVQIGVQHGPLAIGGFESPGLDAVQTDFLRTLASKVRTACERELDVWGVLDRDSLPVRWRTATEDLFDHPENIHGTAEPVALDGCSPSILETYEAVQSGRLVILGAAGAGKTVLAQRLVLGLLKKKSTSNVGPVPVLFSLSNWTPATPLLSWLAQQLVRDFPFLGARDSTTKTRQADLFLERGLVLPVLDGFDEIPQYHHPAAIRQLSALDLPMITTSRPEEYAEAARSIKAVGGAAAISLASLSLDETHDYLRRATGKARSHLWAAVFDRIRTTPDEPASRALGQVLTTPLMAVLARTVYNDVAGATPLDLCDETRFPTREHVEGHLLEAYFRTVYLRSDVHPSLPRHPNWRPETARRWLAHLAEHLQYLDTHDLAWWHLPTSLHRRTRMLVTAAILGLTFEITYGLTYGIADVIAHGVAQALVYGFALGLILGIAARLVDEARSSRGRAEPERLRLHLGFRDGERRKRWTDFPRRAAVEFSSGFALGLAFALTDMLTDVLLDGPAYVLSYGLTYGLTLGFAFGLPGLVVAALGDTHDPHATDPWTLLTRDRAVTLARTVTTVAVVAAVAGCAGIGAEFGVLVAPVRLVFSAWGSWLLFTRLWLPLTGRLPWRAKRFLEDAHARGVLRTVGAVYQFRHARLRDHLARKKIPGTAAQGSTVVR